MNIFVLSTGRCGSTTFARACAHIANYTSSHESRCGLLGKARLEYPDNHIESDNRLTWFLGRLDKAYGDKAFYVHLRRDNTATAKSYAKRHRLFNGIIRAYGEVILLNAPKDYDPTALSLDYCDTVNGNIELFLKDKSRWMRFSLETAKQDFRVFWDQIGAEGDLEAALSEFEIKHNSSDSGQVKQRRAWIVRAISKIRRIGFRVADAIRNA